jgi:hypothetical protein
MRRNDNTELRSKKIRDIIDTPPSLIIRFGTTGIIILFVIITVITFVVLP